jgi:hypothetical protein
MPFQLLQLLEHSEPEVAIGDDIQEPAWMDGVKPRVDIRVENLGRSNRRLPFNKTQTN